MYSLIVPVYRNQDSIKDLLRAVDAMNTTLGGRLEAVFVVDGSPDESAAQLQQLLPRQDFSSRLILLARNFGSFAAIRVGLKQASGEYFAVMAADLQEPPELVLSFFNTLAGNEFDIVIGTRESRADAWGSRWISNIFWAAYRKFIVPQMPIGGVDVFGCNRAFRDYLLSCEESNTSLVALLFWLGFRRSQIAYSRRERAHGVSAWSFRKKLNYMMDSIFAFTDLPIKILLALGAIGLGVSLLLGLGVLAVRMLGLVSVPGYAATILAVLFFGGINTLGLGLVGSYAWRSYENTKRRPLAIIMREQVFDFRSGRASRAAGHDET